MTYEQAKLEIDMIKTRRKLSDIDTEICFLQNKIQLLETNIENLLIDKRLWKLKLENLEGENDKQIEEAINSLIK